LYAPSQKSGKGALLFPPPCVPTVLRDSAFLLDDELGAPRCDSDVLVCGRLVGNHGIAFFFFEVLITQGKPKILLSFQVLLFFLFSPLLPPLCRIAPPLQAPCFGLHPFFIPLNLGFPLSNLPPSPPLTQRYMRCFMSLSLPSVSSIPCANLWLNSFSLFGSMPFPPGVFSIPFGSPAVVWALPPPPPPCDGQACLFLHVR